VLTHVISGSTKITATVGSTGKTYPATVVGYDKTGVRGYAASLRSGKRSSQLCRKCTGRK
jgi:hypothetical protein